MRFLRDEAIEAVIDATHPYADQMSAHAIAACREAGVPLGSLVRPEWQPEAGDRWQVVPNFDAAARALGATPRRVFLSLGRQELLAFAAAPQHHYIARLIERPGHRGPCRPISACCRRGMDHWAARREVLLRTDEWIDVMVLKNSGGDATYAKVEAACTRALPVIMVARPNKPTGHILTDVKHARCLTSWLDSARR